MRFDPKLLANLIGRKLLRTLPSKWAAVNLIIPEKPGFSTILELWACDFVVLIIKACTTFAHWQN